MSQVSIRIPTSKAIIARAHRVSLPSRQTVSTQARVGPVAGAAWATFNAGLATLTPAIFNVASICAQQRIGVKEPGDDCSWTIESEDVREACRLLGLPPLNEDTRGGMSSVRNEEDAMDEQDGSEDQQRIDALAEKKAAQAKAFTEKKQAKEKKKKSASDE
jgi:hypothetical protein